MQKTLGSFGVTIKKAKAGDDKDSAVAVATAVEPTNSKLFPLLRDEGWRAALAEEFTRPYMAKLEEAVLTEYAKKAVFPPQEKLFAALNATPLERVRVVVLGQDPYHAPGQAMGLSFSVPRGVKVPSSLQNIYKELAANVPHWKQPNHGDLTAWAERGVLLLNTTLTVRQAEPGSHAALGWTHLTDRIVELLSQREQPIVFLLWGKHAQDRAKKMKKNADHLILQSPHPSGLSASKGFFGNKHFSKANEFLLSKGQGEFDWSL